MTDAKLQSRVSIKEFLSSKPGLDHIDIASFTSYVSVKLARSEQWEKLFREWLRERGVNND